METEIELTKDQDYDSIFVVVKETEINNNNIEKFSPYKVTETDGTEFKIPTSVEKGVPQCDICFRKFAGWAALYAHKGKLCSEESDAVAPHPLHVHFSKDQLPYISDALKSLGIEVKEHPSGNVYIETEELKLTILLRQLYTTQITKYNIENWYPAVEEYGKKIGKELTATTKFIALSDAELKVIKGLASTNLARNVGMERRETNAELEGREKLEDKIAPLLTPGQVYFCRLSTRSPKDGVSLSKEDKQLPVSERLQKKINLLKVTTSQQIMDLITKSQRIFSDINFFFQWQVKDSTAGQLCLILRNWVDIPQDHEFRCYVKDRKMTAISQYQCYCVFPAMQDLDHVLKIRETILKFHDSLSSSLPFNDYVIDIAVLPDFSCQVIEFNPFGAAMSSGAALFNWEKDYDLMYGNIKRDVPPIRVLKKLIPAETGSKKDE